MLVPVSVCHASGVRVGAYSGLVNSILYHSRIDFSLVKHLLGILFELTAPIHVADLLCGSCTGAIGRRCAILRWRLLLCLGVLVHDHTLDTTHGISLFGGGSVALVSTRLAGGTTSPSGPSIPRLLSDHIQHTVLEGLFVLGEPILLPCVVKDAAVKLVPLHAAFEEIDTSAVVRFLFELERAAILHELPELARVSPAKLLERRLNLLLLDIVILLVL